MKLDFLIIQLGHPLFQNQQESAKYQELHQRKVDLVKQLYEMMVMDGDI
jgi:hypothetical protein